MSESRKIAEVLYKVFNGSLEERKALAREIRENCKIEIDGYDIERSDAAYKVWKHTSIENTPEYKGDSLLKVVPMFCRSVDEFENVLNAQRWVYL